MNNPEDLKHELEELFLFNVEQDIIDFTFSKKDFAPYVVAAFSKGLSREQIPSDVLNQLETEIKNTPFVIETNPKKESSSWLSKLFKRLS